MQLFTPAQAGAYSRLLHHYWINDGPLPDHSAVLRRMAGVSGNHWRATREALLMVFELRAGKWHHARLDEQLAETQAYREQQRELAGRRWARRDAAQPSLPLEDPPGGAHAKADAKAMPSQCPPVPVPVPAPERPGTKGRTGSKGALSAEGRSPPLIPPEGGGAPPTGSLRRSSRPRGRSVGRVLLVQRKAEALTFGGLWRESEKNGAQGMPVPWMLGWVGTHEKILRQPGDGWRDVMTGDFLADLRAGHPKAVVRRVGRKIDTGPVYDGTEEPHE